MKFSTAQKNKLPDIHQISKIELKFQLNRIWLDCIIALINIDS